MKKDQTYKTKVMKPTREELLEDEKVYSFPKLGIKVRARSLMEAYEKLKDLTYKPTKNE